MGPQGPTGQVGPWTLVREFLFDYNQANLQASEMNKVSEIAQYMRDNPSMKVGIDGSMDPRGNDPRDQELANLRVQAIIDALIRAGVPASKIEYGQFGDPRLVRDRRVAVLIRTDN